MKKLIIVFILILILTSGCITSKKPISCKGNPGLNRSRTCVHK